MRPHHHLLLVPLLGLVAGCGSGGDGGEPEALALTRSGGCASAYLWAASDDGTAVVAVSVDVPRYSTMDPVEIDVDLPDPSVEAVLLRGDTDLTRNLCTDVLDGDAEPDETVALTAGAGEVVIGTIPTDVSTCGNVTGTLDLEGVEAEDGTELGDVAATTDDIGCEIG